MTIKNLSKLGNRIKKAIQLKERVILYGDGDLDGITSVIILKETIEKLGGKITTIYFPNREKEGYGITDRALYHLKKFTPALFIVLDMGMNNLQKLEKAKKLGFEVAIIDHHEIVSKIPKDYIVVNPKQKNDKYPFKHLSTVGLTFKLSQLILKNQLSEEIERKFLQLVTIATIADMMPQKGENKILINKGKKILSQSPLLSISAFFKLKQFRKLRLEDKIHKLISVLNVREVKNNLPISFFFLQETSLSKVNTIIKKLLKKHQERKEKMEQMMTFIEKNSFPAEPILFLGKESFEYPLVPQIASKLCQRYKKPVFIFKKRKGESIGSVRSPSGVNVVELMKKCSQYLLSFGGHPFAGGFRIKTKCLKDFKKCLISNYEKTYHLH